MRRRTRARTAPRVFFTTIAIVAVSKILVSSALLSERYSSKYYHECSTLPAILSCAFHWSMRKLLKLSDLLLTCFPIEHPSSFTFEKSCPSSIGNSAFNGNTVANGSVRSKTALHSSLKATNKKDKKRKRKDSSKTKGGASSASSSASSSSQESVEKPLGRSISEDELCTHLNTKVNYGKRGPAGPRARSRGIIETDNDESTDYISDRQRDQQFFLRQLNNRPTLVLNANYLVS